MGKDSRRERMIAGGASSKALNNSILVNKFGRPFIKNADKFFMNSFGASKAVKNENERMLKRFDRKEIKIKSVINVIEILITKNGNKIVNGDAKTRAALRANNMILRFPTKERNNLSNIVKSNRINNTSNRVKTAQVFSGENVTSI